MRVAVASHQGRVSPVFDVTGRICLVEFDGGREVGRMTFSLTCESLSGRAIEVANTGAECLICGAISRVLERDLAARGIKVYGFVCGDLEDVLEAFRTQTLHTRQYRMPGCGRGRRRRAGRQR